MRGGERGVEGGGAERRGGKERPGERGRIPGTTPPVPRRPIAVDDGSVASRPTAEPSTGTEPTVTTVLTQTVARLLLAPTLVVAVAVLVKGYAETGDGFSAGVIAALGVLLQFVAFGHRAAERLPLIRFVPTGAFVGLGLALLVTFAPTLRGDPILTHAPGPDADVIRLGSLELLTAVLFDVGVFLLVFGFAVGVIGMVARAGD